MTTPFTDKVDPILFLLLHSIRHGDQKTLTRAVELIESAQLNSIEIASLALSCYMVALTEFGNTLTSQITTRN